MPHFYSKIIKIEVARAFSVFVRQTEASVGIFPTLDFRNFGSLAVGQTNVTRSAVYDFEDSVKTKTFFLSLPWQRSEQTISYDTILLYV